MGAGADATLASGGERSMAAASDSPKLHALLANPFRHDIAMRMAARPYCATELQEITGRSRRYVTRAIEELREAEIIELVETRTGPNGKGGRAFFYRATRTIIEADEWERLSDFDKARLTGMRLAELQRDQVEALEAGTFHSHPHHTLIRDHRLLDEEGFQKQDEILLRVYYELVANAEASHARCARTGETPKLAVIGITSFPAAPGSG